MAILLLVLCELDECEEDDHPPCSSTTVDDDRSNTIERRKIPSCGRSGARSMVSHLRGRLFNPTKFIDRKPVLDQNSSKTEFDFAFGNKRYEMRRNT